MTTIDLTDDLLNEYLDGALPAAERQAVEAAIAQSPEAQTRLAEYQTLFATFADMRDLPLTTDLTTAFLTAVQQTAVPPSPPPLTGCVYCL
ncbi:MAG: hypothetical protein HC804_12715 [Anaerolineae bacterium]|nr:hypothetical protein [Anaerolineae bacterium]